MTQCGKTGLLGGLLVAADTLIIVKRELGLLLADVLGTSGVEIIWTNKHSWYGKSTHVLFYKVCVIWAVVQPSCHRFHGFLLDVLWSADPPSKENPYEDIELERSCLGSKCISPVFSSSVPDTPTKVSNCKCHTEVFWICSEVHYHACVFNSSPASRGFSDKTQSDGASKSVSFAKPTETLASPPPPASAPRLHPAAPTTLPVSPEILTTADGGRSPRYEGLEASCQNRWFMTNWRRFSGGPLLLQSKGWVTEATLCENKMKWFLWEFLWCNQEINVTAPWLQMVLRINGIFEARRGKKHMKKVSQSAESSSGRGEATNNHYQNTLISVNPWDWTVVEFFSKLKI